MFASTTSTTTTTTSFGHLDNARSHYYYGGREDRPNSIVSPIDSPTKMTQNFLPRFDLHLTSNADQKSSPKDDENLLREWGLFGDPVEEAGKPPVVKPQQQDPQH